jgi:mannose-1-phosphate guanylyltransferase
VPHLSQDSLMVEPRARGTGPVLAWAAAAIARQDPNAVIVSLHSDHVISPNEAFQQLLVSGAQCALTHQRLLTIGVTPTRPETGYGYIKPGARLDTSFDAYDVQQFVEKPDRELATQYIQRGYLWNSGIFIWPARLFLAEVARHSTEIAPHLPHAEAGDAESFFRAVPNISVDEAVLERSEKVAVMPATFLWDDVGAWDAVGRTRRQDEHGNVTVGEVSLLDASNCIAWSDQGPLVLYGTEDLVVVRANNITFVAPRDRTPELKRLIEQLPPELREPKS